MKQIVRDCDQGKLLSKKFFHTTFCILNLDLFKVSNIKFLILKFQ